MKLVVLDAETLAFADAEWEAVAALGELRLFPSTFGEEDTIARCEGAIVAMTNKVPFSRRIIEALPELRCICVLATGYNVIDLEAAREKGIVVCNVPAYSTDSVAQHTLAMILGWTNAVSLHADSVREGGWIRSRQFSYMLRPIQELSELTVGVIGFGEIGRRVGEILHSLGATILASMRTPRHPPAWERFAFASTEEIFAQADVVSLHCPLTADNAGMVNARLLRTMKPNALLINTARGGLVNEQDLADALNQGRIAGAMLDVVSAEPMHSDNPLRMARNCWITPHLAWASAPARRRLIAETAANIEAYQSGSFRNVVS